MFDEPRRHRGFMILLALAALATVPFPFAGRETRYLLGLPLWLWVSLLATAALSGLTAWGVLRYWRDDGDDDGDGDGDGDGEERDRDPR